MIEISCSPRRSTPCCDGLTPIDCFAYRSHTSRVVESVSLSLGETWDHTAFQHTTSRKSRWKDAQGGSPEERVTPVQLADSVSPPRRLRVRRWGN